ncbi:hypothetical protein UCDDA912_g09155 [Diaporthe ampelina]|uniref:LsmAD domain-containing protein n=1 Tax=Diaporthe ampelina TaxID=1214573 RepID=A0A0G2F877_9PEZI|nr:hypothetical protein UCDDA912_g09155 [Diaporthe ampelina]
MLLLLLTFLPSTATGNPKPAGNRVQITLDSGAEFEGIYANNPANPSSCHLKMVQQKKAGSADAMNGSTKRQQNNMSFARGNIADARVLGGNQNNRNGNRAGFQTDSGISGERFGGQRELKRWVADGPGDVDGSLEKATDNKPWDQFAANEEKFGLKTDYDENIYTTSIDRNHPSYKARMAKADQMAREIERSNPVSSHVAEERVMDYSGPADGGLDEEEKYSGVKRPDFPPLGSQNPNKYTPPARRAPAAQSTVKGAPVDPAIISSQLRSGPSKQPTPKPDEPKATIPTSSKAPTTQNSEPKATEAKSEGKTEASKNEIKPNDTEKGQTDTKLAEKPASTLRPAAAAAGRTTSPADKENTKPTSTTIEQTVLTSFKNFASKERQVAERARSTKAKADKEVKLIELKKFADSFKLGTPVPNDLIGIIAKDPKKQQEIQAKALKNAEESRKAKEDAKKDPVVAKEKEVTAAKPGPANSMNPSFPPRHTGLPPNHIGPGPRLNPNTQEFRPNAQPFYPTGPSAASSPRSALNNVEGQGSSTPVTGPVVKRKIKAIDFKKCFALSHVMSIKQPQTGNRAWEENGGLRPPFDTMPTWNSLSEGDDKQEKISYKQLFERPPPYAGAMPTPNPAPVAPQMPHQHQLPFHLQQGAHTVGPLHAPWAGASSGNARL